MTKEQYKNIKSKQKRKMQFIIEVMHRQGSPKYIRLKSESNAQYHYMNMSKAQIIDRKNQQFMNQLRKPYSSKYIAQTTLNKNSKNQVQTDKSTKDFKIPQFFRKNNNLDYQKTEFNQNKEKQERLEKFRNIFNSPKKQNHGQKKQILKSIQHNELNKESSDYGKLNDKINYLQNKIEEMKENLQKKRNQKIKFMETQRTERASVVFSDQSTVEQEEPLKKFITQVPQHKDLHTFNYNPYTPQNSTYYVSQILRAYKQEKSLAREHIGSSLEYLKIFENSIPSEYVAKKRQIYLPRAKGYQGNVCIISDKKTLIFDLDETLIHCNQNIRIPHDLKIKIKFPSNQIIYAGINIRPYAKEILAALYKQFQIMVFTASHSCYANVVIDFLDPQKKYIQHRLFRQHCYSTPQGIYVKDLRIINRSMSKMILVDNAAYSYAFQLLNGIPILPYYQGKQDFQLKALQKYLQSMIQAEDIRQKNRKTFKIDKYAEFQNINNLVQTLYQVKNKGK